MDINFILFAAYVTWDTLGRIRAMSRRRGFRRAPTVLMRAQSFARLQALVIPLGRSRASRVRCDTCVVPLLRRPDLLRPVHSFPAASTSRSPQWVRVRLSPFRLVCAWPGKYGILRHLSIFYLLGCARSLPVNGPCTSRDVSFVSARWERRN